MCRAKSIQGLWIVLLLCSFSVTAKATAKGEEPSDKRAKGSGEDSPKIEMSVRLKKVRGQSLLDYMYKNINRIVQQRKRLWKRAQMRYQKALGHKGDAKQKGLQQEGVKNQFRNKHHSGDLKKLKAAKSRLGPGDSVGLRKLLRKKRLGKRAELDGKIQKRLRNRKRQRNRRSERHTHRGVGAGKGGSAARRRGK